MAKLQAQVETSNGFQIEGLAPSGDYVATCLDVQDEFQVTRRKYQSEETEQVDVTRFLFGFQSPDGQKHMVQTWEMKISGSPKSRLFNFLSDWLGQAPQMGWDYCELKGKGAVIKVANKTSSMGKQYSFVDGISPIKTSLADYSDKVVPAEAFGFAGTVTAPATPASPAPTVTTTVMNDDANCPF
jgi:hypothetical protein